MIYHIHFKSGKVLEVYTKNRIDFTKIQQSGTLNREDFWINNSNVEYIIEQVDFKNLKKKEANKWV